MNPKPDPLKKTTRIPFRFVKGKFVHFDDHTEITELVDGCIGDIVIENFKVNDANRIKEYNVEVDVDFLPSGTTLLARINSTNIPENLQSKRTDEGAMIGGVRVAITLEDNLRLLLRGTKPAKLMDCRCSVAALEGLMDKSKNPLSVNQAYTRISEFFEPHRLSHAGNVFNLVYYDDEELGWQPLSTLRDRQQIEYERQKSKPSR